MSALKQRVVLLTRTEEENDLLGRLFEARGARTLRLPLIEIKDPDSWEACDRAILGLQAYDGVFFTSRNAVKKFLSRIEAVYAESTSVLRTCSLYAIGAKTEEALEEAGFQVTATPEISSAEDLAHAMESHQIATKHFLFPKSSIARDILPNVLRSRGAVVDEVVVYRNDPPRQENLESLRSALLGGSVDVVTFFSPSAVRNFHQIMGTQGLQHTHVAVIGPTTASAAASLGMTVEIVAHSPTAESLVESVEEYFSKR